MPDIQQKNITELRPYPANAKKHPEKQIRQIADSIEAFGFNQPIVADKTGTIIVGHGRYEAAKLLGLTEVPVITLDIDEEKARAYRLADNKLNESDWDFDLVIAELKELSLPLLDLTGFSRDLLLNNDENDDVVPGAPAVARSNPGDLYILGGKHRVICADSTKEETYAKLMGDAKADMVFTDPPYNVNYKGQGKNTKRHIENDHMEAGAFDEFLADFFKASAEVVKQGGGVVYIPFELHPGSI
jgi:hypothetical protein